jgi:superfamily II DNA/RNA helicase
MSAWFNGEGLRTVAVHSGPTPAPRASSLERLAAGELDVVFAVDMFNEGVDVPNVDTVLMPGEAVLKLVEGSDAIGFRDGRQARGTSGLSVAQ